MRILTGFEAIDYAERYDLLLSKYNDPIESAREDLTVDEAHEIAWEDPGLIWIEADEWKEAAEILDRNPELRRALIDLCRQRGADGVVKILGRAYRPDMGSAKLFDNGGATLDRFSAVFPTGGGRCFVRHMSEFCRRPTEVCTGEETDGAVTDFTHLGWEIDFDDLPDEPREQVLRDLSYLA